MDGDGRTQRQILEAAAVAALLSGAPSTTWRAAVDSPGAAWRVGLEATRAVGTIAGGRPGLIRGALGHGIVSLAVGELLGAVLPRQRSVVWGAVAGLVVGGVAIGIVAPRRYPAIAALPRGPQLADNVAFGIVFAWVADRPGRPFSAHPARVLRPRGLTAHMRRGVHPTEPARRSRWDVDRQIRPAARNARA